MKKSFERNAEEIWAVLEEYQLETDPETWEQEDLVKAIKQMRRAFQLLLVAGIVEPHKIKEALDLAEVFE